MLICVLRAADQRGSLSPSLSLSNSAEHVLVSGLHSTDNLPDIKHQKQCHPPNNFINNTTEFIDDCCL